MPVKLSIDRRHRAPRALTSLMRQHLCWRVSRDGGGAVHKTTKNCDGWQRFSRGRRETKKQFVMAGGVGPEAKTRLLACCSQDRPALDLTGRVPRLGREGKTVTCCPLLSPCNSNTRNLVSFFRNRGEIERKKKTQ